MKGGTAHVTQQQMHYWCLTNRSYFILLKEAQMKKSLYISLLLALALVAANPGSVSAQSTTDTVYIPGAQSLNISKIINADTAVTKPRVYVLDRGAIYYIETAFEVTHSAKFMAKGTAARPPVLAPAIRADGSSEEWFFKFTKKGIKVEVNDMYLLSMRSDGKTLGWSRAMWIGADSIQLRINHVVFDGWTEAGIRAEGGRFFKLVVQNSHFRNLLHSSSYFGGQPFMTDDYGHTDTTVFKNNTFFACNAYLWSVRGVSPYSLFEHNSVVYGAVNPFLLTRADNVYIKNNLFYDMHAWGGDPEQVIGGWFLNYPDTVSSGILQIRKKFTYKGYATTGPEVSYANLGVPYNPANRTYIAQNNAYFWDSKITGFYQKWNDTVKTYDSVEVITGPKQYLKRVLAMPRWINDLGLEAYDSLKNPQSWDYSSHVNISNNLNVDPQFSDADTKGHADSLVAYVKRIATRQLDNRWDYKIAFPPKWPVPENLVYTNATLKVGGSDGKPLGDLNWFGMATTVRDNGGVTPTEFSLAQNYPNPFNPSTTIKFKLSAKAMTTLKVYNVIGQEVASLINGEIAAGNHEVDFDASHLSSGVYFYTLHAGNFVETKKMMLMK